MSQLARTIAATGSSWPSPISVWAVLGVFALLLRGISRLLVYVVDGLTAPGITWLHLAATALWVVVMVWSEGYRGFHRGFSPRVAGRAHAMAGERRPLYIVFAPLVALGFLNSTTARKLRSTLVYCAIIGAILLVRLLPQPWRGIVDAGVVAGLLWGAASLLLWFVRIHRGAAVPVPLEFRS